MGLFNFIKRLFFFGKKEERDKKKLIKNRLFVHLEQIAREHKTDAEKFHEYSEILRKFFSEFFNIHYEFTYKELFYEVEKKRLNKEARSELNDLLGLMDNVYKQNSEVTAESLIKYTKKVISKF